MEVTFPAELAGEALDGRLLVMLSTDSTAEPRFRISDGPGTQLVFGIDVEGWEPGAPAVLTDTVFGYPLASLSGLPTGRYWVQALLNRYETFNLSTGHTVKLPPDRGEGQVWNRKPGNLYSTPVWVDIDPAQGGTVRLSLAAEIPPIEPPADTEWIKRVRIQSDLLTEFYGAPMFLGAHVLLPAGFDDHPDARYPLVVNQGHFGYDFTGWRTEPADTTQPCVYSARFSLDCYNHIQEQYAYEFYQDWTGPDFPRVILIEIQHPTPYYDDSYGVNSASQGPWGDAIMYELIPEIERQFRGIGEGWARFTYGGSTGGWISMAVQVLYPDEFNGAWVACPDPIDFRHNTVVDIYSDRNAYWLESEWKRTPRPGRRDFLGHVSATLEEMNHLELVLGTKGRSGQQWDIWEATYSPQGPDGYPRRLWDKRTGEIDPEVAEYWRENFDLVHILKRDWESGLGEKLEGKLFIYVGDMDNYYLNNAVYEAEAFLESTTNPYYAGEVDYGDRAEHCWNGDHTQPNAISRLRYHQMFIPRIVNQIRRNGPVGADMASWRY
ncbi:MAG: hypothetical protein WEA09_08505 [Gemmatimonadota bacterium]